jgi:hypothetical protein
VFVRTVGNVAAFARLHGFIALRVSLAHRVSSR